MASVKRPRWVGLGRDEYVSVGVVGKTGTAVLLAEVAIVGGLPPFTGQAQRRNERLAQRFAVCGRRVGRIVITDRDDLHHGAVLV